MLQKKKKLSRKEIKEDKLVSTYYKTVGLYEENKSRILLYAGALVVLAAAIIFYINNKKEVKCLENVVVTIYRGFFRGNLHYY